jgi:hypothetical protein
MRRNIGVNVCVCVCVCVCVILLLLFLLLFIKNNKRVSSTTNTKNANTDLGFCSIYRNVLPNDTFLKLRTLLPKEVLHDEKVTLPDKLINGRKRIPLNPDKYNEVYTILNDIITGHRLGGPPIDYRLYYTGSSGMPWHKDVRVLKGNYYEGVFTVWNNSDSLFEYILPNGNVSKIWTEPNMLVLVKPEGIMHRVTPVHKGNREILKCVFVKK